MVTQTTSVPLIPSKQQAEKIETINPQLPTSLPPASKNFVNLRDNLNDEQAQRLSQFCLERFRLDDQSRSPWKARYTNWLRLNACQPLQEKKTEPWDGSSNVLLPVLTIANTQFYARAVDTLLPARKPVLGVPVNSGSQEDIERANRVGDHLSYQVLYKMPNFAEGMEVSLMNLPMSGTVIRKTYYDPQRKTNISEFVPPENFVINYYTRDLDTSQCYTQIFNESYNEMLIKQAAGIYSNVTKVMDSSSVQEQSLEPNDNSGITEQKDKISGSTKPLQDLYSMREMLEMHIVAPIFNDDGKYVFDTEGSIARRFVVTIDRASGAIVRIVDPRYFDEEKGAAEEVKYFTKYTFLPSPDGSFYGLGFGLLLEGTVESVNTIINQLIDAGHLANTQSGFINKRSGISRGQIKARRGEFVEVNVGPDGLQNAIMPLTFREPSQVLFTLLELLQNYANRVTTVSDVFTGEMPRSDTSATAMTTTVEQGLKVFSAIYRSIHRSFSQELRKMFILNGIYLDEDEYFDVVGNKDVVKAMGAPPQIVKKQIAREDYKGSHDVIPASDPAAISKSERIQKAQLVYMTILQNPTVQQMPDVQLLALAQYLQTLQENDMNVKAIIEPIQQNLMMMQQAQQLQQAQMQADAIATTQKMEVLGAARRKMEEGELPPDLLMSAMQDMQGAPGPQ